MNKLLLCTTVLISASAVADSPDTQQAPIDEFSITESVASRIILPAKQEMPVEQNTPVNMSDHVALTEESALTLVRETNLDPANEPIADPVLTTGADLVPVFATPVAATTEGLVEAIDKPIEAIETPSNEQPLPVKGGELSISAEPSVINAEPTVVEVVTPSPPVIALPTVAPVLSPTQPEVVKPEEPKPLVSDNDSMSLDDKIKADIDEEAKELNELDEDDEILNSD